MNKQVGPDEGQPRRVARERAFRRYAHINKQLLTELYYEQRLSTVDIARQLGVCRNVIWEYMEMYDLERRRPGQGVSQRGTPRWGITCGMPFVTGLNAFFAEERIYLSPKAVSPKPGTVCIISSNRATIRAIGAAMYQYGSLWLLRKKRIFEMLA